jgi:hypothetical protein
VAPFLLEHTVCHLESLKLIDTGDTSNKIKINHDHQLKKIINKLLHAIPYTNVDYNNTRNTAILVEQQPQFSLY